MILGVINERVEQHFTINKRNGDPVPGFDTTGLISSYVYDPDGNEVSNSVDEEYVELIDYSAEFNSSLTRANLNFDFSFNYIYEKRDRSKYRLAVTLVDHLGNLVYERKLVPDKTKKLASHNINLRNIDLWSPETPNLYTANFEL